MAFERDPERQLRVKILDYNSLEIYQGPLTFSDGMSTVKFNGKRIVGEKPKTRRHYQISCTTFLRQQVQKMQELNIANI